MLPESPPHAAWRKSSHSTATGSCVEVAPMTANVLIRHSKHPDEGTITFPDHTWAAFLRDSSASLPTSANGIATITRIGTDTVITARTAAVDLRFDEGEWAAFTAGIADGEFDFTDLEPRQLPR